MRSKDLLNDQQKEVIPVVERKMEFRVAEKGVQEARKVFAKVVNPGDEKDVPCLVELKAMSRTLIGVQYKIEEMYEQSQHLNSRDIKTVLEKMKEINEHSSTGNHPGTTFSQQEMKQIDLVMGMAKKMEEIMKLRLEPKDIKGLFSDFERAFDMMNPNNSPIERKKLYAPGEIPELYGCLKNSKGIAEKNQYLETLRSEGVTDEKIKESMQVSEKLQLKPAARESPQGPKTLASRAATSVAPAPAPTAAPAPAPTAAPAPAPTPPPAPRADPEPVRATAAQKRPTKEVLDSMDALIEGPVAGASAEQGRTKKART